MSGISINPIKLGDWGEFVDFYDSIKEEDYYKTLGVEMDLFEQFAKLSFTNPSVYFLLVRSDSDIVGFVVGHITIRSEILTSSLVCLNDFFVRALYLSKKAPRQTSTILDSMVCRLMKSVGISRIYGHCKPELAESKNGRLGYVAKYVVMEKNLDGGHPDNPA